VRTEQLLREALNSAADQTRTPEVTMTGISSRLGARRGQRHPRILVVAVAVVIIALAIALRSVLIDRAGVPADQRMAGN
jgi:hypothetical protein